MNIESITKKRAKSKQAENVEATKQKAVHDFVAGTLTQPLIERIKIGMIIIRGAKCPKK